jgi:hypothetical protein
MAHFAELDENNVVGNVIVIADKDTADEKGEEKEEIGIAFCKSLFGEDTKWVQTSFNSNFRGKFAGRGDTYNSVTDKFEAPYVAPTDFIDAEEVPLAIEQ